MISSVGFFKHSKEMQAYHVETDHDNMLPNSYITHLDKEAIWFVFGPEERFKLVPDLFNLGPRFK
jgi:hypothetical protein